MSGDDVFDLTNTVPADSQTLAPSSPLASLLDLPPAQAAQRMLTDWDESYNDVKHLTAEWKANTYRGDGYTGVRVIKQQNDSRVYIPLNSAPSQNVSNKAGRLRRRLRATVFADPPVPDATPGSDSDQDRDAAETATRVLVDLTSEGGLDYALSAGEAFDRGSDYGSGFIWFYTNPQGGGWRRKQIEAHPQALTEADALAQVPPDGGYVLKYVKEDGTLTDDPADPAIQREWLPKLEDEILDGTQVRMIPATCRDIWDADGVMIGVMTPLGTLKAMFPDVFEKMPQDQLAKIVSARPQHADDLIPAAQKQRNTDVRDDALVFVVTRYHVQSAKYPKGYYGIACGTNTLLHRGEWFDEQHDRPMDIPVTQFKHFIQKHNPYGVGAMSKLGPGNEMLARVTEMILTQADRLGSRKTFLPMHSNIQPQQLQSPIGSVLYTIPGGEPKYEDIPDVPPIYEKLMEWQSAEMDDESGLQAPAQGLHEPGVDSAKHANTLIEQSIIGISDLVQHSNRAITRGWRIMLQLVRRDYTIPQQIGWVGEDGAYKVKDFQGSDLGSTKDVRIAKGSFTQLTPTAKAGMAQQYAQLGILPPEDLLHALQSNLGGMLGLQDNPHLLKVRRQIAQWEDGPPPDWTGPQPQVDPNTGQPMVDPMGQPVMVDPVIQVIFTPCPVDDDPKVAMVRYTELGRAIAGTKYHRFPPPWQQGITAEYVKARTAAGVVTIAEQQAQMQQQAQAQQQQAQAQTQQQDADRQQKATADETKNALQQQKMELDLVREQMKIQAEQARDMAKLQTGQGPIMQQVHQMPRKLNVERDAMGQIIALEPVQ